MGKPQSTATVIAQVVDSDSSPVADATVRRIGYRLKEDPSSAYGAPEGPLWPTPGPLPTDTNGQTTITYPVEGEESFRLFVLIVEVSHPDYCNTRIELSLENPSPMRLQRGTQLTVTAIPNANDLRIYADIATSPFLPPSVTRNRISDQAIAIRLPSGSYAVRAVGVDATGRLHFSEPQKFETTALEVTLIFDLTPGRYVRGELDHSVPRPVERGVIIAEITTESAVGKNFWRTSAPIAEDGTFTLTSIPRGHLALIALCDGFLSVPTDVNNHRSWKPQIFASETPSPLIVKMTPAGTARVRVLGPDHSPLTGATVQFCPNQQFQNGNSLLSDRIETLHTLDQRETPASAPVNSYQTQTDSEGIALIPNLPAGQQIFFVHHDGYEMPIAFIRSYPVRDARLEIIASRVVEQTVEMEKASTRSLGREIEKYEASLKRS